MSPLQVIVLVVLSIENLDYALQRGYTRQERPEDRAAVEYGFAHEAAARVQMALSGIQRWLLGSGYGCFQARPAFRRSKPHVSDLTDFPKARCRPC